MKQSLQSSEKANGAAEVEAEPQAQPHREYDQELPLAEPAVPPAKVDRSAPVPSRVVMQSPGDEPFRPFAFFLAFIGNIFLLTAFLVGLAIALHVPAMIAVGIPDPSLARELNRLFGDPGWPQLIESIGIALTLVLLLIAMVFIILARRKSGPAHLVRAALGLLGLFGALTMLADAVPSRYSADIINMINNNRIGPALSMLISQTDNEGLIYAAVLFTLSVITLAWMPRRRREFPPAFNPGEGV